jgi:hypothetical protein
MVQQLLQQRLAALMMVRAIQALLMLDLPTRARINFSTDVYFASFTYKEN